MRGRLLPATIAVVAVGASAAVGLALAQQGAEEGKGGDPFSGTTALERDALEQYCPEYPCRIINIDADQAEGKLESPGRALAREGIPASECPAQADALAAAGPEVDAFIGRCPSAEEVEHAAAVGQSLPDLYDLDIPTPPEAEELEGGGR